jgi:transcriptional regulator
MFEPDNGKPINNKKTEVKVLYDNEAIYISAMLYDNEPNKIQKEITNRDVLVYLIIFQCLWI